MNQSKSPSLEYHNIKGTKRHRLIVERKIKGLTQTELASEIGVSTSLISHLENGRLKPSLEISLSLQQLYGLEEEILFPDL